MGRVLLHDSHSVFDPAAGRLRPYGGAPGEGAFVVQLNDRLAALLRARGVEVGRVPGDLKGDHPEFTQDWSLFVANHYESDTHGHEGGWFWGRAAQSLTPLRDDAFGALFERRYRALPGVPPQRQNWMTVNVTDYYAFRATSARTPGVLIELGVGAPVCHGHGQPSAPDHDWLRANIDRIAELECDAICEFLGMPAQAPRPAAPVSAAPADPTDEPVAGPSQISGDVLEAYLRAHAAGAPVGLGHIYAEVAQEFGLRAEVLMAQALHETGKFKFEGDVKPDWNNWCGLDITSKAAVRKFDTPLLGAVAHAAHMAWYAHPSHQGPRCSREFDPRHFVTSSGGHRGNVVTVRDLGAKWAPSPTYGERVAKHLVRLRQFAAAYQPPAPVAPPTPEIPVFDWDRPDDTPLTLGELRRYARALAHQLDTEFQRKG